MCQCGNETFSEDYTKVTQRCCIPSNTTCDSPGVCSQGHVIPETAICENDNPSHWCFNAYQESEYISELSQYACPNMCIPVNDICQGIAYCDTDISECNTNLRCPPSSSKKSLLNRPEHYYCDRNIKENNRVFEAFDRSDETELMFDGRLDHTHFHQVRVSTPTRLLIFSLTWRIGPA